MRREYLAGMRFLVVTARRFFSDGQNRNNLLLSDFIKYDPIRSASSRLILVKRKKYLPWSRYGGTELERRQIMRSAA
jgi:hypothetical protein